MAKEVITDNLGRVLATITTDSKGNSVIKDYLGQTLGRYDSRTNTTYNFTGQVIGNGNQLTRLIK